MSKNMLEGREICHSNNFAEYCENKGTQNMILPLYLPRISREYFLETL